MSEGEHVVISKRLVAINSASFVLTRLINVSAIVWLYQYLLGRIPPEEFSVYPVVSAVMIVAPLFFTMFTGGVARYVIDAYARGDREDVTRVVSSIFPLIAGMSVVFVFVGLLFTIFIGDLLNIPAHMLRDAQLMMGLLIISFAAQMVALPFTTGFNIKQKFVELNMLMLGRELLRVGLLMALLFGVGAAVRWVVVASVVAEITSLMVIVPRSRWLVPELRFVPALFNRVRAQGMLSFGVWTALGQLGTVLYTQAATIVLNLLGTPVDVTVYFIGSTIYYHLQSLILTAVAPLQPVITAMQAKGDMVRLANTLLRGGRYGLWVSLLVAVPLVIYAQDFILLYVGPNYVEASTIIVLFMVILPFSQATVLLPMTCIAMAKVRVFFLPAFLFQLAGFVLMIVFAGPLSLGAVGVTLALAAITIVSQVTYYWALGLNIVGATFSQFFHRVLIPGWLPGVAAFAPWWVMKILLPPDSWLWLIFDSAVGGGVYILTIILFCLDPHEKQGLLGLWERLRRGLGRLAA